MAIHVLHPQVGPSLCTSPFTDAVREVLW